MLTLIGCCNLTYGNIYFSDSTEANFFAPVTESPDIITGCSLKTNYDLSKTF